jgi:imidazolonepropionase-like amidohydrolase
VAPWPVSAIAASSQPTARDAAEARVAVRRIAGTLRPPLLKVFYDDIPPGSPRLDEVRLRAVVDEAKAHGMRPVAHIGSAKDMLEAAEAGVALLMHPPSKDLLDDAQLARLATLGTPFVTTVNVLLGDERVAETGGTALEREIIEPKVLEQFRQRPSRFTLKGFEEVTIRLPENARNLRENTRRLVEAGVPFYVGSDASIAGVFPGASLHNELAALVSLGISPGAALRAATSAPARFLDPSGPSASFGRVAPGQRADLLLVRGDPLEDIARLGEIEMVLLDGAPLERRAIK